MSATKRALERLWAGTPTPEDIEFAGGSEAAASMRQADGDWPAIEDAPELESFRCLECDAPTTGRLCTRCYVRNKT